MGLGNITFGGNNIRSGAYTDRPANPNPGDWYTALDTGEILACFGKKGYHIETAVFTQSIDTQDSSPTGLTFNNDGTKLYEVGGDSDKIYEYELSVAFDISTATYTQSMDTQDSYSTGIALNSDGTKLYVVGGISNKIYEYELTVAYNISTANFTQSIDAQDSYPTEICFNTDGTKLYEVGSDSDKIYEYELSVAFDISTATYTQSMDTQDSYPTGIALNSDGTKLYEVGFGSDKIYEYELTVAYNISTATYTQSIDTQDSYSTGICFNTDGTKLYEVGAGSDKIYEYELTKVGEWESIAPTEPVGTIKMFSGYQSNIPPKWQICDGTNGTPDLRNRFVVGAGDTYNNGDTGGESEHTLTVGEMPPHNHSYIYDDYGSSAQDGGNNPYVANESNGTNYVSTEGGGQPHENRPPYYALYYIMKVSE
jgi:DNA-binding beta-propeller fold protein YncE